MLHGGGWGKGGDKGRNPGMGGLFVKYGFATATLNRRCVPEFPFPAQIIDTKSAVRWLRAHAEEYNLDTDHFGVWGHSAGGHLGALLATTGDTREFDQGEYLDQSSVVQAVFDRCGPTDFETWHEGVPRNTFLIPEMFGGTLEEKRDLVRSTSPLHRVSAKAAPMLIVHAIDDVAVPYSQSQKLDEALRKAGVPSELLTLPAGDGGHGSTQFNSDEVKKKMMEFFVKYLKANDE
jgi:acetyl esterase/lipase